jgi:hypothetical protein
MTALELFRVLIPSKCDETDGRVGAFLDIAAQRLTAAEWGGVYSQALVFLAAHLMTLSPGPDTAAAAAGGAALSEGGAGPITKKKAGDLEVTFGSAAGGSGGGGGSTSNTDVSLLTTQWGREFLALRDTRAGGMPFFTRLGTG